MICSCLVYEPSGHWRTQMHYLCSNEPVFKWGFKGLQYDGIGGFAMYCRGTYRSGQGISRRNEMLELWNNTKYQGVPGPPVILQSIALVYIQRNKISKMMRLWHETVRQDDNMNKEDEAFGGQSTIYKGLQAPSSDNHHHQHHIPIASFFSNRLLHFSSPL